MKIAVAGGTGMVGQHIVAVAREAGHEVMILARSTGVDLVAGTGLAAALQGVDVVVDVASVQTQNAGASREFFGAVTGNLLAAEQEAGVDHHVALSIVGIDRAPGGYYAGKMLQEELVTAGSVPWTILRATQFHEFASQIHGAVGFGPVTLVPAMRSEPIAAHEVAERLVELATSAPAGRVADLGGPQERRMADMVRAYARRIGDRRRVLQVPLPGILGKGMRKGWLITGEGADHGTTTFDEWLATVEPDAR